MAKTKAAKEVKDTRTQRQKFIDKAREIGADESPESFDRALSAIAKAPPAPAKKPAPKRKR